MITRILLHIENVLWWSDDGLRILDIHER